MTIEKNYNRSVAKANANCPSAISPYIVRHKVKLMIQFITYLVFILTVRKRNNRKGIIKVVPIVLNSRRLNIGPKNYGKQGKDCWTGLISLVYAVSVRIKMKPCRKSFRNELRLGLEK